MDWYTVYDTGHYRCKRKVELPIPSNRQKWLPGELLLRHLLACSLARNDAIYLLIIQKENEEMAKISSWFRKRGVFRLLFSHNGANATNEANQTTSIFLQRPLSSVTNLRTRSNSLAPQTHALNLEQSTSPD
jgi:hypothetical protein